MFVNKWGTEGTGDGQFRYPSVAAVASDGSVYVGDNNHRIVVWGIMASPLKILQFPIGLLLHHLFWRQDAVSQKHPGAAVDG